MDKEKITIRDESKLMDGLYEVATGLHDYIIMNKSFDRPDIIDVYDTLVNTLISYEDDGF